MKLCNLITIADPELTMCVYGKNKNKESKRFNFVTGEWDDELLVIPERCITVDEFRKNPFFKKYRNAFVLNWSIRKVKNISGIPEDYHVKNDIIVNVSIKC